MRPLLYRIASHLGLKGRIFNHPGGVGAELEGSRQALQEFHRQLLESAAEPIRIHECRLEWTPPRGHRALEIVAAETTEGKVRHSIQPDAATCSACWRDHADPQSRFFRYPFVTCCECGPRWTILERFPFERSNTSYADFPLCDDCLAEYRDPRSRRHHAQTLSCPACGPRLSFRLAAADRHDADFSGIHAILCDAGVGLVKGLGGFQLIGNAHSPQAISRIRALKQRPAQALALMVRDAQALQRIGGDASQWQLLATAAAPIVALAGLSHPLAPLLAPDLAELGVMAPTTALHRMLFNEEIDCLVVTSGNPRGFPLPRTREDIRFTLGSDIDFIIDHERRIVRAVDDSVVRGALVLRKARGLAPCIHHGAPEGRLAGNMPRSERRLALGTDLKNALALQLGTDIIEFPYAGDLLHPAVLTRQAQSLQQILSLFDCPGSALQASAVDIHPGTFTCLLADREHVTVPHHAAHAWAALSQCPGDLVLAFDGTGHDEDLALGGGDGLVLRKGRWHRVLGLKPIAFAGGDSSVAEPWKSLVLHFAAAGIAPAVLHRGLPDVAPELIDVFYAHARATASPSSTSMGRWFDAAAALIEFGGRRQSYEAQAPIRLEHLARPCRCDLDVLPLLNHTANKAGSLVEIDGAALLLQLFLQKHEQHAPVPDLAWMAHDLMAQAVAHACRVAGSRRVTAAGGVFQNALFAARLREHLAVAGIAFALPSELPVNDQSIAMGQLLYLANLHA